MRPMKYEKIACKIKKAQTEKRFEHTLGVAYTAAALAMKYDIDVENARLAGLLHDCAKQLTDDKRIELCQKYDLPMSQIEMDNPFLLHGKVGKLIANKKFGITDEDILNAICFHTTGRPAMSLLEKIIFVSDYIEPNRKEAPNLIALRKLAFEDIDLCVVKILEDTLQYLNGKKAAIDPATQITYDYYVKEYVVNGK